MRKYTTTQGDLWDVIAKRVFGREQLMHVLIDANSKYRDIVVFPANCELTVPAISTQETISFPSWRAGS